MEEKMNEQTFILDSVTNCITSIFNKCPETRTLTELKSTINDFG